MGSSCSSTRDVRERVELDSKKKRKSSGNEFSLLGHIRGSNGGVEENSLLQIPGRIFANGGSKVSCLFTQQGKKGTNQDAMIVWENFDSRSDTVFCGVFDGHGPFGHMVAKKVRDSLPLKLSKQWNAILSNDPSSLSSIGNALGSTNSEETASLSLDDECYESLEAEETKKLPEMYLPLKQSMLKAFKIMDKDLKMHPTLDCFCSGSTAVTLIKQGQDLVLGNVGDSRAVLATREADNTLVAVQLTVDLKPNLPREAARIQRCKGRVFALQDEPEVARVWLPNSDSPGLAMARAFGDFCLKDFGLISVPDISYRRLTDKDEFIVLATDGIWDVLSNKEAIEVVASAPSRATAARALVDCANRAWRLKYPTSKVDDCAVICLYIDHTSKETESTNENGAQPAPGRAENKICAAFSDDISATKDSSQKQDLTHVDEIVPAAELTEPSVSAIVGSRSMRSLAQCISTTEDEEWSALEGVTRVNSLLSLPRFLSGDKRSASWRKWL